MHSIAELTAQFPRPGRLDWIGLRPARDVAMHTPASVSVLEAGHLQGDRYAGRSGKRGVTLLQAEHLPVIAALAGLERLDPATLRRNLIVSGLNLLALRGRRFRIGDAEFEGTGPCAPCSRMETALGPGAYNAMRGHGGITARVVRAGTMAIEDPVIVLAHSA
ncbi:MAG TPA: MOSC domain-containing protein [Pseudomonadales bacterium]|nr:MOSC domain-containing protein [Pseudomonadales bacterium]